MDWWPGYLAQAGTGSKPVLPLFRVTSEETPVSPKNLPENCPGRYKKKYYCNLNSITLKRNYEV
jgi:hypothetical protein